MKFKQLIPAVLGAVISVQAFAVTHIDIDSDTETALQVGAYGIAGFAPPPLNSIGLALITKFWNVDDGGYDVEQAINQLNGRLDTIQSNQAAILDAIVQLRSDIRSDFEIYFSNRDHATVIGTMNYVIDRMEINYTNAKNSGADSYDLLMELEGLEQMLSQSLNWYLQITTTSDAHKMAALADFIAMAELHLMIIQEGIQIYSTDYLPCDVSRPVCTQKSVELETLINNYHDSVDRYAEYLYRHTIDFKVTNLSNIGGIYEREDYYTYNIPYCYSLYLGAYYCQDNIYTVYTGDWLYQVKDHRTGAWIFNKYLAGRNRSYVEREIVNYKNNRAASITEQLQAEIYPLIDNLISSKHQFQYVDGVVAQNCAVLYSAPEFDDGQNYSVICDNQSLDSITSSTGLSNVSSVQLGQDVVVELFSDDECGGFTPGAFYRDNRGNDRYYELSDYAFDGVARSARMEVYSDENFIVSSWTAYPFNHNARDIGGSNGKCAIADPYVFGQVVSNNGRDPGALKIVDNYGVFEAFFKEDTSQDSEVDHINETVDFILFDGFNDVMRPVRTDSGDTYKHFAEVGSVQADDELVRVNLKSDYVNPVIFLQTTTYNGSDSFYTEILNIGKNRFDVRVRELENHDGPHVVETINYLVVEQGTYPLANGKELHVGTVDIARPLNKLASDYTTIHHNYGAYQVISHVQRLNRSRLVLGESSPYVNHASYNVITDSYDVLATRIGNKQSQAFDLGLITQEAAMTSGRTVRANVGYLIVGERQQNYLQSMTEDDVLGNFTRLPITNSWHPGVIESTGSDLQWRNEAGVSWALTPDFENGVLLTGPDCPYFNNASGNGKSFILVIENNQVTGFTFQGELYSRD